MPTSNAQPKHPCLAFTHSTKSVNLECVCVSLCALVHTPTNLCTHARHRARTHTLWHVHIPHRVLSTSNKHAHTRTSMRTLNCFGNKPMHMSPKRAAGISFRPSLQSTRNATHARRTAFKQSGPAGGEEAEPAQETAEGRATLRRHAPSLALSMGGFGHPTRRAAFSARRGKKRQAPFRRHAASGTRRAVLLALYIQQKGRAPHKRHTVPRECPIWLSTRFSCVTTPLRYRIVRHPSMRCMPKGCCS